MQYKEKCQVMEARLNEVNELSNQSRAQLGDSADVLRGLEAKLRHTEVNRQILHTLFQTHNAKHSYFWGYIVRHASNMSSLLSNISSVF